ncbi:type VII secretion system-associated protein [Amycolatopsis sp. cg5]|uniref:type VII secretion system-associated protein n=1 Tax=Amycolatopsis sp. cg5 TaxID=3238802 RepID=UPI003523C559
MPDAEMLMLVDPDWKPSADQPNPPREAVSGAWTVSPQGVRGRFEPNPVYRPLRPETPLDPLDAVLRGLSRTDPVSELLAPALRDALLAIAVDEQDVALVRRAPDGTPVVMVVSAYGHREQLDVPAWRDVTVEELAEALPAKGIDVLVNPASTASIRIPATVVFELAGRAEGR